MAALEPQSSAESVVQFEEIMLDQAALLLTYLKQRAAIEVEYAAKLVRLHTDMVSGLAGDTLIRSNRPKKTYFPKLTSTGRRTSQHELSQEAIDKANDALGSTLSSAINTVLQDSGLDGLRHEDMAKSLNNAIIPKFTDYLHALREQLKDAASLSRRMSLTKLTTSPASPSPVAETQLSQIMAKMAEYEQCRYAVV